MFLVNSCHILVAAHFLLWYTQIPYLVLSWGALPINNNERWMARITSYWRSIKFNQFIARVRSNKVQETLCVTIAMTCSTLASSRIFQSFQRCIYQVEPIWWSLFLQKLLVDFSQKSFITDVRPDCKYFSTFTLKPFLPLIYIYIYIYMYIYIYIYIYILIHQACTLILFNWHNKNFSPQQSTFNKRAM